jgi:hypothetical protein
MMQVATSATPIAAPSYTEKAQRHKDGSVLLSVANDRICKLNGVGALTWMVLEDHRTGITVDDLVQELSSQFDAINAEGQLRYEVTSKRLLSDTARFLKQLTDMHLVQRETDSQGQERYYVSEEVTGTTASTVVTPPEIKPAPRPAEYLPRKRETFTAFVGLLAFDLLLKFRGFQSLIAKVEQWPTAEPRTTDLETCWRIGAAVDRAQMYYPKKAMCLQHSAVLTCLLRRRGVPAEMILAAQHFPAKAHAWVEVAGTVVNGSQSIRTKYFRLRQV